MESKANNFLENEPVGSLMRKYAVLTGQSPHLRKFPAVRRLLILYIDAAFEFEFDREVVEGDDLSAATYPKPNYGKM